MRIFCILPLLYFISCTPQNNSIPQYNFIVEYINLIGEKVPEGYIFEAKPGIIPDIPYHFPSLHENGNVYRKIFLNSNDKSEVTIKLVADDNDIVQSCYVTFSFSDSDFDSPRAYHRKLYEYIKNEEWQYIENISKTKLHGELFLKNNVYIGIYEPINFISIGLTTNKENFVLEGFCHSNNNIIEMTNPIEYYKNEIIRYADNYYGFRNISMEITQLMNISSIVKLDNFIPHYLTFLVSWFNVKGYIFYLYTFDDNQNIAEQYYCGDMYPFENHKILMQKLTGDKLDYGNISIGDFNNDGITEIALYSQYKNIGFVFCIYGYNIFDNKLEELLLVPVYINLENPFPSVEYIGNGFKILEITDEENMELSWNKYIWNSEIRKYIKSNLPLK